MCASVCLRCASVCLRCASLLCVSWHGVSALCDMCDVCVGGGGGRPFVTREVLKGGRDALMLTRCRGREGCSDAHTLPRKGGML